MSKIKVNTIAPRSGSTVTLGEAGNTIALGACASQTGFGRTGTVDWCTTAKTSPFTAVNGKGYFVNTTGGAITVTLPSGPSAGDIISVADYANTWATACKAVTLCRNSSKINAVCQNAILRTEGQSVTLVYVDGTRGWKNTMDSTSDVSGAPAYITASGGNTTITCGDYKTHIFTADGCFSITQAGQGATGKIDYLVIAGGAGGGGDGAGGGGAGGFRLSNTYGTPAPTMSPLATPTAITASPGTFPITVGGGGTAGVYSPASCGGAGGNSIYSTITSAGGGNGARGAPGSGPHNTGGAGGSGGGGTRGGVGGAGNTPPVSPPQGNAGGPGGPQPNGDGGGGAGAAGGNSSSSPTGGVGGAGSFIADGIIGPTAPSYGEGGPVSNTRYFAGGGGGGGDSSPSSGGAGGVGGGGDGGTRPSPTPGTAGSTNMGAGGGGAGVPGNAGAGGSGIVILRYKFQN